MRLCNVGNTVDGIARKRKDLAVGQEQVHPSCGLAIRVSAVCGAKPYMRQRRTPPQQAGLTKGLRKDTKHVGNENSNQIQFTIINH